MNDVSCNGRHFSRLLSKSGLRIVAVFFLSCSSVGLFSSAYAQQVQANKAQIIIESISNSAATRGKNLVVTYYQDEQCGRRGKTDRVFKKNYVDDEHSFNPLAVETDVPFIFQVSYLEKRRAETRSCAAISNVELKPNRSYKAVFKIVDEVIGCNISVFDVTDIIQAQVAVVDENAAPEAANQSPEIGFLEVPVMDRKPEFTCARVGKPSYKSGTPVYTYKDRLG